MNTRTPCIILALLALADSVPANPVLPAIIAVGRDAAVSSIIQWTLAEGVDAAKAYWAGPTVIPYISLVETRARHAEFEKGTGEETQWKQRLASYMAIQPGTKIQYIYETRTRRVPVLGQATVTVTPGPFVWSGLERRLWHCSPSGGRPTDPMPTYRQFSMSFKLGSYCTLTGATEANTGPWSTKVLVGRTLRQAGCEPVAAKTENIIRAVSIPASGLVCFEWDKAGNFLYDEPKFLRDKPDTRTEGVNVLPDPRRSGALPAVSPVAIDGAGAPNF